MVIMGTNAVRSSEGVDEMECQMIAQVAWLDREFVFGQPIGLFPIVLKRSRHSCASQGIGFRCSRRRACEAGP